MVHIRPLKDILSVFGQKDAASVALVTQAYTFTEAAHGGQTRYSGEPYFLHPAEVGYMLADMGMDAATVAAGMLHDTIEDARASQEEIKEKFGEEVLFLVEGVTKLGHVRYRGAERHAESLRKLFAATAQDIRVLIIKLTDRLHNARTLEHVPEHKRARIALETLEVYAPIADRLGMSVLKTELEDAAFPHAYPKEYQETKLILKERRNENEKRLEKMERDIMKELAKAGIRNFKTESRVKGVYSLYRKLERKGGDITRIHDIIALRIIVPDLAECYRILGIIHSEWRPVPGKIKDYIAFPKPNGYQSIHTTVYTGDGSTLEIQLRTEAMHREAQFGIASHLTYKEGQGFGGGSKKGSSLEWIRNLLPRWRVPRMLTLGGGSGEMASQNEKEKVPLWVRELTQTNTATAKEDYVDDLKADFFNHRVFVFTPNNDVLDLPVEATPIDFAYAIHSDIGDHTAGARVNGKMVSLDTKLKNGDVVEIISKPSAKPSRKWLDYARTTMAKKHIRAALEASKEKLL